MAKFVKEFENGIIKSTLTFRGQQFVLTMGEWDGGCRKSIEKSFELQLEKAFPNDDNLDEILEAVNIIDYGDDEEIEEALEELSNLE